MNGGIPDLCTGSRPGFLSFLRKSRPRQFLRWIFSRRIFPASIPNRQECRCKDGNGGNNMASGTMALEGAPAEYGIWRVIMASSVGTMIEWYDFYIFGSLAAILSPKFYPPGNETFAYIAYLATFAVGFLVRPFGALFFGRIGDMVGRKYAFLVTLSV